MRKGGSHKDEGIGCSLRTNGAKMGEEYDETVKVGKEKNGNLSNARETEVKEKGGKMTGRPPRPTGKGSRRSFPVRRVGEGKRGWRGGGNRDDGEIWGGGGGGGKTWGKVKGEGGSLP